MQQNNLARTNELYAPTPTFCLHLSFHDHSSIISYTGEEKLLTFIFPSVLLIPHSGTGPSVQSGERDAIASLHHFALCLATSVRAIRKPAPFMSLNEES